VSIYPDAMAQVEVLDVLGTGTGCPLALELEEEVEPRDEQGVPFLGAEDRLEDEVGGW
jgi:hypothetical protein